jgi:hypothetical protein
MRKIENRTNLLIPATGDLVGFSIIGLWVFFLLFFCPLFLSAQETETVVVGQILNKADKTPIPQVNIYFKNTNKAVQSNEEGYFLMRYTGKESLLIFSSIGYKNEQIKVKPGQSVGIQVEMEEESTQLREAFIIPGVNPAIDLMKKVRLLRKENDVSRQNGFKAQSTEQNLVFLSKINLKALSKHIFDQLKKGNISHSDSALVIPLFMDESKYELTDTEKKQITHNIFSSSQNGEKLLQKLVGEISTELNFYENTVSVFGKNMVSPLANVGNAYYDYFLADSVKNQNDKQYEVHFRTKNPKNLAFNGKLWIDSATFSLTRIETELPSKANINFIHNLLISENFVSLANKQWTRESESMTLNMNYELLADSLHQRPEIFVKRTATYQLNESLKLPLGSFAQSNYDQTTLDEKLQDLNNTPLLRTAKLIAKVILTGDIPAGKIDIGNILQLARLSHIEGLRFNLPLKTNEKLWKNATIGGYVGYGLKNQTIKYSAMGQYKLPGDKKRVIGLSYTDDYRRIDYNYNNYMYHENPLVTGDEDISTTLLMLWSANRLSRRTEFNLSFSNDWNSNIESTLYFRSNRFFANTSLPMETNNIGLPSFLQRSVTLNTRFSSDEKNYEDHLQRIYILNSKPVFSLTVEGGQYVLANKTGGYGKLMGAIKQYIPLDIGNLYYVAEAGCILGKVPYPLLEIPSGSEAGGNGIFKVNIPVQTGSGGYSMYQYNMMKYMEYGADKYFNLQSELTLNGIIMNQIPLIKSLNLRELFSFKMAYGSLSNSHQSVLDYPNFMEALNKPYMEVGVGLTNILHIFAVQSVWRLTDTHKPGVFPWGIRTSLSISF